jgi:hypothetical protein
MKTVHVVAYQFDSLPGHITVSARGTGANLRVATQRAISSIFRDKRLRYKQIGTFTISVVAIPDRTTVALEHSELGAFGLLPKVGA